MPTPADFELKSASIPPSHLSTSDRRIYEALFHHPSSHNLKWHDVVHLFEKLGTVTERPNHEYVFLVGGVQYVMRRPHSKDLVSTEIRDLRHFLTANVAVAEAIAAGTPSPAPEGPDLLIVIDHHEARVFDLDLPAHDAPEQDIRPYDPHHFLHHLTHKDQPRERGQRAHEDATFYDRIAQAVFDARRIIIIGRGTGKSDAAHHLIAYLAKFHVETSQKLLRALTADLSHITAPELLAMGREAMVRLTDEPVGF